MTAAADDAHVVFDDIAVRLGEVEILHGIDVVVHRSTVHGLVGPNGSGKSTLLRVLYRSLRPVRGVTLIDGAAIDGLDMRALARKRSTVPQDAQLDADFTVRELVAIGRTPHRGPFDRTSDHDRRCISEALDHVDLTWAAERPVSTLSGGERQRALIARALAQRAELVCLDEPTNHLDAGAQFAVLELIESLGLTAVIALHDLGHALRYCDDLTLLDGGRVVASGAAEDVLAPERVSAVFGVESIIRPHPITGRPHLTIAPRTTEARP